MIVTRTRCVQVSRPKPGRSFDRVGVAACVLIAACSAAEPLPDSSLSLHPTLDTLSDVCSNLGVNPIGRIGLMVIDSSGRPILLDRADGRLVVIGSHDRCSTIGRRGRGPGEFSFPTGLSIAKDGRIAVRDQSGGAVSFFDETGRYLERLTIPLVESLALDALMLMPQGLLAREVDVGQAAPSASGPRERFRAFDHDGKLTGELRATFPVSGVCARPSAYMRALWTPFAPMNESAMTSTGRIIGGCTDSDSVWSVDFQSQRPTLLFVLERGRSPYPNDVREFQLDEALERYTPDFPGLTSSDIDTPERMPAWYSAMQLSQDEYLVIDVDTVFLESESDEDIRVRARYGIVIVNTAANTQARMVLPQGARPDIVAAAGNTIYTLLELESGDQTILRITLPR